MMVLELFPFIIKFYLMLRIGDHSSVVIESERNFGRHYFLAIRFFELNQPP
jgi:hypothetical protein